MLTSFFLLGESAGEYGKALYQLLYFLKKNESYCLKRPDPLPSDLEGFFLFSFKSTSFSLSFNLLLIFVARSAEVSVKDVLKIVDDLLNGGEEEEGRKMMREKTHSLGLVSKGAFSSFYVY